MRRMTVVTGIVATSVLATATPALASGGWGSTTCSQTPSPACHLGAGTTRRGPDRGARPHRGAPHPSRPDRGGSGSAGERSNGDVIIPGPNLAHCSYKKSDYQPPAGGLAPAAYTRPAVQGHATVQPAAFNSTQRRGAMFTVAPTGRESGKDGSWYLWKCSGKGFRDAVYRPPMWMPDQQQPDRPVLPSPAELAQTARKQLRLPAPTIAANPAGEQLVNLPTWLWLSNGWTTTSATASVPGVSVTAVATPTSVSWSMGDGSTVVCSGPGTPFTTDSNPTKASPDCGHTYRSSSASQPGQAFPVSATVQWTVTWSGAGQGGTFPDMTTTGNAEFRVAESQALMNNGGG